MHCQPIIKNTLCWNVSEKLGASGGDLLRQRMQELPLHYFSPLCWLNVMLIYTLVPVGDCHYLRNHANRGWHLCRGAVTNKSVQSLADAVLAWLLRWSNSNERQWATSKEEYKIAIKRLHFLQALKTSLRKSKHWFVSNMRVVLNMILTFARLN